MDISAFKRALTAFADVAANIDISRGKLFCEIRDGLIEADIRSENGEIFVTENGEEMRAHLWIVRRVARLPLLADRLLAAFPEPDNFIEPSGTLMDQLDDNEDAENELPGNAISQTLTILNRRPVGSSSVVYLTSDAGEGKTTLITHMARLQAAKFQSKESDWLLVPIPLGGKPFFRFDDLVVGYLGNRLRFPLFYYEAFMELVKMGVVVPAFDGFEEMFVQSPSGDALSAIGQLLQRMDSCGTVLIAARKAYFEYQDMRSQAKLFDSIGKSSVIFSRVSLKRWDQSKFLEYCDSRCVSEGEQIYQSVAQRLSSEHPLLTRAVLVKRLLDVASETQSLTELLQRIGNSPNDYFAVFVKAIIEREAQEKWINRTGEPHTPLLSVREHFDLLASIAQEMWALSTDSLKSEVLDLLTELFCESRGLKPDITHQVRERTKQHALIIGVDGGNLAFAFDHEEFKNFFLGDAIGRICTEHSAQHRIELLGLLRQGSLSSQTIDAAASVIHQSGAPGIIEKTIVLLQEITSLDGPTSYTQENVARLLIRILNRTQHLNAVFSKLTFSESALQNLQLSNVKFSECAFASTSLENTELTNCHFENCRFDQLELSTSTKIAKASLKHCEFVSVVPASKLEGVYDPEAFDSILRRAGFQLVVEGGARTSSKPILDSDIKLFSRLLRCFQLRTHLNQNLILRKLGPGAETFIREMFPKLIDAAVLGEDWNTRDKQRRYHLTMSLERIHETLLRAGNTMEEFLVGVKTDVVKR